MKKERGDKHKDPLRDTYVITDDKSEVIHTFNWLSTSVGNLFMLFGFAILIVLLLA